mmetsp:Transcript_13032/g.21438  ORF Transcript_13032/g.21438 Transcript_13032/m.21438 type:complete len:224 (+) Transcript_13032:104-775(+)
MCGENTSSICGMCVLLAGRPSKSELLCKHWVNSGFTFCRRGIHCDFWHPESAADIGPCKWNLLGSCTFGSQCMAGHHFQRPNGNFTCQVQHNWTHKENIPGEEESGEGKIPPLVENLEIEEKDSSASESGVGTDSEMDKDHNVETPRQPSGPAAERRLEMVSQVGSTLSDGDEPLKDFIKREVYSDIRDMFASFRKDREQGTFFSAEIDKTGDRSLSKMLDGD